MLLHHNLGAIVGVIAPQSGCYSGCYCTTIWVLLWVLLHHNSQGDILAVGVVFNKHSLSGIITKRKKLSVILMDSTTEDFLIYKD